MWAVRCGRSGVGGQVCRSGVQHTILQRSWLPSKVQNDIPIARSKKVFCSQPLNARTSPAPCSGSHRRKVVESHSRPRAEGEAGQTQARWVE